MDVKGARLGAVVDPQRPSKATPKAKATAKAKATTKAPTLAATEGTETARTRLLAAALEVFAEHGFDGAKTRDIAARAGENLGLISYYFGTKDALWREAVGSAFAELRDAVIIPEAAGEVEPLIRGFVRFLARRPAFMQLMNDESRRDSERMRWLADTHVRPFADAVAIALASGDGPSSALSEASAASLHYIVLGATGLLFSQAPECRRLYGVDPSDPAVAEAHADTLVRIFTDP